MIRKIEPSPSQFMSAAGTKQFDGLNAVAQGRYSAKRLGWIGGQGEQGSATFLVEERKSFHNFT
jgi:hypothetical protein